MFRNLIFGISGLTVTLFLKIGFNKLSDILNNLTKSSPISSYIDTNNSSNTNEQNNDVDSIAGFMRDDDYVNEHIVSNQTLNLELEKEKLIFSKLVEEKNFNMSSYQFWIERASHLPILRKIFFYLSNIPSSSAFIKRYFSLCGIVCKKRSGNIDFDLIISRSMLKANIKILNDLNATED